MNKPRRPRDFGKEGNQLWVRVTTEYELTSSELRILADACAEVEIIEALTDDWIAQGRPMTSLGSMKQEIESAHLQALRQHRSTLRQLIQTLRLPDLDEDSDKTVKMTRQESARKAANVRWRNHRGVS